MLQMKKNENVKYWKRKPNIQRMYKKHQWLGRARMFVDFDMQTDHRSREKDCDSHNSNHLTKPFIVIIIIVYSRFLFTTYTPVTCNSNFPLINP